MTEFVEPLTSEPSEPFREVMGNHLFDRPGPKRLDPPRQSRDEVFAIRLFYQTGEVSTALEALRDIEIYVRRFPYRGTRITKPRHLRYHVESFLNETYLLHERLVALLNIVKKSYRKDPRAKEVARTVDGLLTIVRQAMSGPVRARGAHVHETRFSDEQIDRLETLDLLTRVGSMTQLEGYYDWQYRDIRRAWRSKIKQGNEGAQALLDHVFDALYPLIFDDKGQIRYPVPRAT